jgi:hypothetical protein
VCVCVCVFVAKVFDKMHCCRNVAVILGELRALHRVYYPSTNFYSAGWVLRSTVNAYADWCASQQCSRTVCLDFLKRACMYRPFNFLFFCF